MGLADKIKLRAAEFTPAEHRIAQVLFSSNMLAGLETIAKLGEKAQVSGPTVLRFSAKLGFDNYPALQDYLRDDIRNRLTSPLDLFDSQKSSEGEHVLKTGAAQIFSDGIVRTLSRIDNLKIDKITALLADRSRPVHFIGGRLTQPLAELLWGEVHLLRPRAYVLRSGAIPPKDFLVDVGRRDVLVVFDIRRYQQDVIRLAELAHARRATIILITDPLLSPISYIASHVITCDLDTLARQDSLVPCVAVIELLVASLSRAMDGKGRARMLAIEDLRIQEEELSSGC